MRFKNEGKANDTVFLIVVGVVCFLLASSVMPFIGTEGNVPCPNLLLCLCCALPRFCDKKPLCIYAVVLGFLSDLFINTPHHISPVVFLVSVLVTRYFYGYFKNLGNIAASVCAIPALVINAAVGAVILLNVRKGAALFTVLSSVLLPEMVVNFAFVLALGFIIGVVRKGKRKL